MTIADLNVRVCELEGGSDIGSAITQLSEWEPSNEEQITESRADIGTDSNAIAEAANQDDIAVEA